MSSDVEKKGSVVSSDVVKSMPCSIDDDESAFGSSEGSSDDDEGDDEFPEGLSLCRKDSKEMLRKKFSPDAVEAVGQYEARSFEADVVSRLVSIEDKLDSVYSFSSTVDKALEDLRISIQSTTVGRAPGRKFSNLRPGEPNKGNFLGGSFVPTSAGPPALASGTAGMSNFLASLAKSDADKKEEQERYNKNKIIEDARNKNKRMTAKENIVDKDRKQKAVKSAMKQTLSILQAAENGCSSLGSQSLTGSQSVASLGENGVWSASLDKSSNAINLEGEIDGTASSSSFAMQPCQTNSSSTSVVPTKSPSAVASSFGPVKGSSFGSSLLANLSIPSKFQSGGLMLGLSTAPPRKTSNASVQPEGMPASSPSVEPRRSKVLCFADDLGIDSEEVAMSARRDSSSRKWSGLLQSEDVLDIRSSRRRSSLRGPMESDEMAHCLEVWNRDQRWEALWLLLDDPDSSAWAKMFSRLIQLVILASVMLPCFETLDPPPIDDEISGILEVIFESIFFIEIITRFASCPSKPMFFQTVFNWIEMSAIMSFTLRLCVLFDIVAYEKDGPSWQILLCVVPVLRILKMCRHFQTLQILLGAFILAAEALPVLLYMLLVITLASSCMIYIVEPRDNIPTLATAIWLTIVTMTTVGYGDATPSSSEGYLIVSVLCFISVLFMAMPIGIIGSAFNVTWSDRDRILLTQRTRQRLKQWGCTSEDVMVLFKFMDSDGDGALSLEDFDRFMGHMRMGLNKERVAQLFYTFDSDGSGTVDAEEFIRVFFPSSFLEIFQEMKRVEDFRNRRCSDEVGEAFAKRSMNRANSNGLESQSSSNGTFSKGSSGANSLAVSPPPLTTGNSSIQNVSSTPVTPADLPADLPTKVNGMRSG